MSWRNHRSAAFTIVEVLLALAIVGMAAALILPGVTSLLRAANRQDPGQVLRESITSARLLALESNRDVTLHFNRKANRVEWTDGIRVASLPWPPDVIGRFLSPQRGAVVLSGGRLQEAGEVGSVRFHADGTCEEFRASVRPVSGTERTISIDRWTCAEISGQKTAPSSP